MSAFFLATFGVFFYRPIHKLRSMLFRECALMMTLIENESSLNLNDPRTRKMLRFAKLSIVRRLAGAYLRRKLRTDYVDFTLVNSKEISHAKTAGK